MYKFIENIESLNIDKSEFNEIEYRLVEKLRKEKITLATAESITGGLIASKIVNVAGASDIYSEGYITYSDEAKNRVLGIDKNIIEEFSAVSKEVCCEMLKNTKKISKSNTVIVSTGYAGPGENAGEIFIGINIYESYFIIKLKLKGDRNIIRETTANISLSCLKELLSKTNS
ncbi:CinA family protein [Miniphocaeibacter massiliensis]|uniref:CinA family protein n=1 Tax=Miniphocaeibacter massiliensis TaxID=2041841 RepID=UPI000C1C5ACA|nr:CinA family protein [Miniphocaeibacter massiliensis]